MVQVLTRYSKVLKRVYMDKRIASKKYTKILFYLSLAIIVFIFSLLILPLELFLFTSVIVLVTLRAVEKELQSSEKKSNVLLPHQ
jgi:hypothetical protein